MSKRAEQRGLEAVPSRWRKTKDGKGKVDSALPVRKFYIRAYEQAEKDVWERIEKYLSERNPTDYATVGWILKNIEEYKKIIMEVNND